MTDALEEHHGTVSIGGWVADDIERIAGDEQEFANLVNSLDKTSTRSGRRRGRQKKKWADTVAEWTGKGLVMTQAFAHDRR